jgi:hypothetical protein
MTRECEHCRRPFTPADFVKEESEHMEADRKALGLEGVRFRYYRCPGCGHDAIFLDLLHRDGETDADFQKRRGELEAAVREVHARQVDVILREET